MSHENEKARLKKLMPKRVYDIFKQSKCFVAGGAVASLFTNNPVNDIDVYFKNKEDVKFALQEVYSGEFDLVCTNYTDKSLLFVEPGEKEDPLKVQFIVFDFFKDADALFNSFDFTVCMGAYDFDKEEFTLHPDFLKHNSQRYLKYNPDTRFPLISALRVDKYKDKGYSISKPEMLRVLLGVFKTEINSWDNAKEHIGGMYGLNMEDVFDENKPFSVQELIDQMDTLPTSSLATPLKEVSLGDILYKALNYPIRFYKYVKKTEGGNMMSSIAPSHRAKVYKVGSTVNGGDMGIFARVPGHHSNLSVFGAGKDIVGIELRPVNKDSFKVYSNEAVLYGDVEVVRTLTEEEMDKEFFDGPI